MRKLRYKHSNTRCVAISFLRNIIEVRTITEVKQHRVLSVSGRAGCVMDNDSELLIEESTFSTCWVHYIHLHTNNKYSHQTMG